MDFKLFSGPGRLLFPATRLHANHTLHMQNQDQQSGSSKWNAAIVNFTNQQKKQTLQVVSMMKLPNFGTSIVDYLCTS